MSKQSPFVWKAGKINTRRVKTDACICAKIPGIRAEGVETFKVRTTRQRDYKQPSGEGTTFKLQMHRFGGEDPDYFHFTVAQIQ